MYAVAVATLYYLVVPRRLQLSPSKVVSLPWFVCLRILPTFVVSKRNQSPAQSPTDYLVFGRKAGPLCILHRLNLGSDIVRRRGLLRCPRPESCLGTCIRLTLSAEAIGLNNCSSAIDVSSTSTQSYTDQPKRLLTPQVKQSTSCSVLLGVWDLRCIRHLPRITLLGPSFHFNTVSKKSRSPVGNWNDTILTVTPDSTEGSTY